jgi:hypothetical protein
VLRDIRGDARPQHIEADTDEQEGQERCHQSKDDRFGDELPRDAASTCAQRAAHPQLAPPIVGACEQKAREIGARDEQHEARTHLEDAEEGTAAIFGERGGQWLGQRSAIAVRRGIELFEAPADDVELGVDVRNRGVRSQLAKRRERSLRSILGA